MDLGIEGKVALVTGGSHGLGKQVAITLAEEGCKVAICARNLELLNDAEKELKAISPGSLGIQADVTNTQECNRFFEEAIKACGPAQILVNNVGGTKGGRDFDSASDQDWLDTLELNLLSTVRMVRLVLPEMKRQKWGRIVNIASIYGRELGGNPTYMAAKAALIGLSKHLGVNLAPYNILVNSVAPGSILFPGGSWDRFCQNNTPEAVEEFINRNLPMGKFGWPEPVGDLVAFLASDDASYVTGCEYVVDGGMIFK